MHIVTKACGNKKDHKLFLYVTSSRINGFWCCFHC